MDDGYYLLHGHESGKPIPVEIYTIAVNPGPRQFVRGLNVACTLRRAIEKGYTFEPLYRNHNLIEQTIGNLEYFEQDANDLDKALREIDGLKKQLAEEEESNWPKLLGRLVDEMNMSAKDDDKANQP